jgi:hypothetical protein
MQQAEIPLGHAGKRTKVKSEPNPRGYSRYYNDYQPNILIPRHKAAA